MLNPQPKKKSRLLDDFVEEEEEEENLGEYKPEEEATVSFEKGDYEERRGRSGSGKGSAKSQVTPVKKRKTEKTPEKKLLKKPNKSLVKQKRNNQ